MRRRDFIAALGGAAAAWPMDLRAQQNDRARRIGVLMTQPATDSEGQSRFTAFLQALQKLGWIEGRNLQIDVRWGSGDPDSYNRFSSELLALEPDVILSATSQTTFALQKATRTVPIVFAMVLDPVGGGIVESLSRPGGNVTGFMQFEYSLSGKWLELLKQIAPGVTRAAVFRDPIITTGIGQFAVIQALAPPLGVEVIPINVRDTAGMERAVASFARISNGGMIVTGGTSALSRDQIIALAARYRLPAVYPYRFFVAGGGLMSYGPDLLSQFGQAATYVDRVLRGEKPADLPVQAPTKYQTTINLTTAKALGLNLPASILARADEVIE